MKLYVTGQAIVTLPIKEQFPYSWWLEWHRRDSMYQTTLLCVDFDSLAYLSIISLPKPPMAMMSSKPLYKNSINLTVPGPAAHHVPSAASAIYMLFEHFEGQWFHHLPGQPVPCSNAWSPLAQHLC